MHIIGRTHILWDDAVEIFSGIAGRTWINECHIGRPAARQMRHNIPHKRERMGIIIRDMIDHARGAAVEITAAKIFGADFLTRCRLDERRASEKNRALVADDNCFIRHGGHICATCGAAAHHAGDLWDALGRHIGLIEEYAPKMLPIREYFGLMRQVCPAAIHQIDAG